MHRHKTPYIIVLIFVFLYSLSDVANAKNTNEIYRNAYNYTVFIRQEQDTIDPDDVQPASTKQTREKLSANGTTGSGIVIKFNNAYFVLTANHIVEKGGVGEIYYVWFEEEQPPVETKKIGWDARLDMALLVFSNPDFIPPSFAPLGNSSELEIGDEIFYAMGTPAGLNQKLWITGRLSKKNVSFEKAPLRVLAFDMDCTYGFSGGPIINQKEQVVALINFILDRPNSPCYAVPIDAYSEMISNLFRIGEIKHGTLGIAVISSFDFTPGELKKFNLDPNIDPGVYIVGVLNKSPAKKAGLKPGDRIITFGNEFEPGKFNPGSEYEFIELLNLNFLEGDTIIFNILREGKFIRISAKLEKPTRKEKKIFIPVPMLTK